MSQETTCLTADADASDVATSLVYTACRLWIGTSTKVWKEVAQILSTNRIPTRTTEWRNEYRVKISKHEDRGLSQSTGAHKDQERSHEAVLQKAREKSISGTTAGTWLGPPTKPDPERWLPKFERSYARRRRNRGGQGAQGGVSGKTPRNSM
jgi:hypothetical protein